MKFNAILRTRSVQWLRHLIRFAVLLFIFAVPILAHYRGYLANQQIEEIRRQDQASLPRSVILATDRFLRDPEVSNHEELATRLKTVRGNTWSADLLGISLVDPLAGAESVAASRKWTPFGN
jgi:hypothetical protein